jgi:multidrug efflux pump subunit AcrA (membrane-fusion protein)
VQNLRRRINPVVAGAVAVLLVLPFLLPWTIRVAGNAIVEPQERIVYRVAEDARVETVSVEQGAAVPAGTVLAVLRNPQLELQWTQTQATVASLERVVQVSARDRDFARSRAAELDLAARRAMLERLRVRRDALVMRAPFAGRIVTSHPERLAGATIEAGDSVLELHRAAPLRARVYLAERDAGDLDRGDVVRIKFPVRASWTWQSPLAEVSTAARNGYLELLVPLARTDSAGPLRAGMTGKAKVAARRTTMAGAVLWNFRRTFRTDLWL